MASTSSHSSPEAVYRTPGFSSRNSPGLYSRNSPGLYSRNSPSPSRNSRPYHYSSTAELEEDALGRKSLPPNISVPPREGRIQSPHLSPVKINFQPHDLHPSASSAELIQSDLTYEEIMGAHMSTPERLERKQSVRKRLSAISRRGSPGSRFGRNSPTGSASSNGSPIHATPTRNRSWARDSSSTQERVPLHERAPRDWMQASSGQRNSVAFSSTSANKAEALRTLNANSDQENQKYEEVPIQEEPAPALQYYHAEVERKEKMEALKSYNRLSYYSADLNRHSIGPGTHLSSNGRKTPQQPRPTSSRSSDPSRASSPSAALRSPDFLRGTAYPQPPPQTIALDNSELRGVIGTNASLLSKPQVLQAYAKNLTKATPDTQYAFALVLVGAAQEAALREGQTSPLSGSIGKNTNKSNRRSASPFVQEEGGTTSSHVLLKEARSILQHLASSSYPFAQYYLGDGFASGMFTDNKKPDNHAALGQFVAAAKHGHAESGYRAGLSYEFGWGTRADPSKAVQYYEISAARNHPGSMTRLGKACLYGELGLGNRYKTGIKWLNRATEAADEMHSSAPYILGLLYEEGDSKDVFKDEIYAVQLFTKAAELGNVEASFRLGEAYELGRLGCPKDAALSVHFYTGAAQRGHGMAMYGLCAWYMVGARPVLERDEDEAYEWAVKAATCDNPPAKALYAVAYFSEMGIGCNSDNLAANRWYVQAAEAGDERAARRLKMIEAAASGRKQEEVLGGTPMEVGKAKDRKLQKGDDKECIVM